MLPTYKMQRYYEGTHKPQVQLREIRENITVHMNGSVFQHIQYFGILLKLLLFLSSVAYSRLHQVVIFIVRRACFVNVNFLADYNTEHFKRSLQRLLCVNGWRSRSTRLEVVTASTCNQRVNIFNGASLLAVARVRRRHGYSESCVSLWQLRIFWGSHH
jgi:hypothetical protein